MQHGRTAARDFHENDPRRLSREAVAAGNLDEARVWAELATAEAIHRLAKTVGKEFGVLSAPPRLRPVDGGSAA